MQLTESLDFVVGRQKHFSLIVEELVPVGDDVVESNRDTLFEALQSLGLVLQTGVDLLQQNQQVLGEELLHGGRLLVRLVPGVLQVGRDPLLLGIKLVCGEVGQFPHSLKIASLESDGAVAGAVWSTLIGRELL